MGDAGRNFLINLGLGWDFLRLVISHEIGHAILYRHQLGAYRDTPIDYWIEEIRVTEYARDILESKGLLSDFARSHAESYLEYSVKQLDNFGFKYDLNYSTIFTNPPYPKNPFLNWE